jgi:hypothetical protein
VAFKKGQSGNPGGRTKEKLFTDALRVELNRETEDDVKRKKLNAIAEKLVECALVGESWAIQQVADRMEGRPQQAIDIARDTRTPDKLSGAELVAIVGSRFEPMSFEGEQLAISSQNPTATVGCSS